MMRLTHSTWNPSPTFKESRLDSDEGQHYGDPSLRLPGSQLVQSEAMVPPEELAAVWVHKAGKGSDQWVNSCTVRQLEIYRFRKRLAPLTVLVKFAFLSLSFLEEPCWRLACPKCQVQYSWQLPHLPFHASNNAEILCLVYFIITFYLREVSLGAGNHRGLWHLSREVLVAISLTDCLVANFNTVGIVPGMFRICRLCRPLIFITVSKFVRRTVNRLWRSFLNFADILAALGVAVLFFMWLAIVIFSRSEEGREHFHDWPEALASLWVLFTTANFPDVMIPIYTEHRASFFFFFLYLLICLYLLNNVLLAAVYDAYKDQLKDQVSRFLRLKSFSISQAFSVMSEKSPDGSGTMVITMKRWVDFYTAYGKIFLNYMFDQDYEYLRQQAQRTFNALDADSNGYIERQEFCMVVEVLANPGIYIPMRPVPKVASSWIGEHLVHLFMQGVRLRGGSHISWRVIHDFVVLVEVLLALGQTIVFVSPGGGGKFRDSPLRPPSPWFTSLMATSVFFAMAIILESIVIGPARYWNRKQYRHRFDVVSIAVLMATQVAAISQKHAPDELVRLVLVIHISRGMCLMQYIAAFRYLLALLARLLPVYYRLGLLLLMVFYIFTTIGEQIFGGRMKASELKGSGYAAAEYWPLNFDDFPSGLVTLFSIMVINNWFVLADGFMKVTTPFSAIFFVLFFVIVNLIVLNILIALIIDTSAIVREEILEVEQHQTEVDEDEDPEEELHQGREALLERLLLNEGRSTASTKLNVLSTFSTVPTPFSLEGDSSTGSTSGTSE